MCRAGIQERRPTRYVSFRKRWQVFKITVSHRRTGTHAGEPTGLNKRPCHSGCGNRKRGSDRGKLDCGLRRFEVG